MLKKLLSVVALVTMLATQTAFAAVDNAPLKSFTVTPTTFNPKDGEKLTATVAVTEPSLVSLKVLDITTSKPLVTIYSSKTVTTSDTVQYAGMYSDGTYLPEGQYLLDAIVTNTTRTISTDGVVEITVDYDNNEPPVLTGCEVKSDGVIQDAEISPCMWNPDDEELEITWELDDDVDDFTLTAEKSGEDDVELMDEEDVSEDDYSYDWDGIDEDDDEIEEGTWNIVFEADNDELTIPVVVDYDYDEDNEDVTGSCGSAQDLGVIENADVDDCTWDPTEDDLEITWELNDDVDDFTLTAEKSGEDDVELMDEEDLDDDDYDFAWDGLDEDGDIVEEGTWYIVFEADNDRIRIPVKVSYDDDDNNDSDDVKINSMFVTKTSLDNDENEFTYVVFKLDDDATVTVDVLKGSKTIDTLVDEKDLDGDVWHAIKWDGKDDDNDKVKEGDYKFKVTAENDDNDKTTKSVTVEVKEDELSSNKSNVTNDSITPVIIDKGTTTGAQVTYKIDDDAEVTVAIYKGDKTSGEEIFLEKNKDKKAGTYTIKWDGRNDDNKKLSEDTKYSYLITAKVDGSSSKVDKERGYFVIGEGSTIGGSTTNCSTTGFWDVSTSSPYCEAIVWAKQKGIIDGYADGSFRQYNFINRVEALKVALEAFSLPILSSNYTNLGFTDVQTNAWYVPYLRTGKFYGMVAGYGGTTLVKPASEISRVEILRYIFEAAEAKSDYEIPVCNSAYYSDTTSGTWYSNYVCLSHDYELLATYSGYFYPGVKATRGEVVLALYKLYQEGLLK